VVLERKETQKPQYLYADGHCALKVPLECAELMSLIEIIMCGDVHGSVDQYRTGHDEGVLHDECVQLCWLTLLAFAQAKILHCHQLGLSYSVLCLMDKPEALHLLMSYW